MMSTVAYFPISKTYSMPSQLITDFKLSSIEANIIDILKGACAYSNQNTVMRIAGGWLLGNDSMDIDIALDNISGIQFAEIVNEYMKSQNLETHTIGKIEANPEQSKHLETARVRILNEWIDLVNLRSENYVQNSRIPTITYGTPKEDAFRRDLTINALFYNINENKVEDFTEKGTDDLLHGIIRTPLEPLTTLTDDPLRALRAIRFASRYNYKVNDELYNGLSSQEALCQKVSNERIGKEFCEILLGPNPQYGIELLYFTGLLNIIIKPIPMIKTSSSSSSSSTTTAIQSMMGVIQSDDSIIYKQNEIMNKGFLLTEICEWLIKSNLIKISTIPTASIDESTTISLGSPKSMLYFICLIMPIYLENHISCDDKSFSKFVKSVVNDTLKCKNSDCKICENILLSINLFQQAIVDRKPVSIGRAIKLSQEYWEVALELTFIYDLFLHYIAFDNNYQIICDAEKLQAAINQFNDFHRLIYDLKLDSFYNVKALLNGKDIMNLGVPKGPAVKKVLDSILEWQMENPDGSKEQCELFVKSNIIS